MKVLRLWVAKPPGYLIQDTRYSYGLLWGWRIAASDKSESRFKHPPPIGEI